MVRVDDRSERRPIGFLAQIPSVNPGELRLRHALRCIGHSLETEIGAVGEDGREQARFRCRLACRNEIRKGMRKAGAAADFVQKLGNANSRHQPVEGSVQTFGFRWRNRLSRRYVKNSIAKDDAFQAVMA